MVRGLTETTGDECERSDCGGWLWHDQYLVANWLKVRHVIPRAQKRTCIKLLWATFVLFPARLCSQITAYRSGEYLIDFCSVGLSVYKLYCKCLFNEWVSTVILCIVTAQISPGKFILYSYGKKIAIKNVSLMHFQCKYVKISKYTHRIVEILYEIC